VIHDQEIARLPHRMPQNDQENQANFIEIERLLNQRPSYVPWTLNYPSSFDFNDPCVTQTRITDLAGSAGKLKIVKEHDWTALTIDFHSSFQTTAQDSVFNFFAKVESGFIAPDPILIGVSNPICILRRLALKRALSTPPPGRVLYTKGNWRP
jgi:hypothetical protein